MPRIARSEWYDIARDMNWTLSYVDEAEVFPEVMCNAFGVPSEQWWSWDEPYKITYREYVHNQTAKDASVYAVNSVVTRSTTYEQLDPGWKAAVLAHYGLLPLAEYLAMIGEARMARFGRAAAWRNQALYGSLDETRHAQLQAYFAHQLLGKEPRADWAHKALHTNHWGAIAQRSLLDDTCTAADAVSTAVQLTFAIETGFTNLQFLGLASDALNVGDLDFAALISSIQTDEARHAQQGEPTIRMLIANGRKDVAQHLVDVAFWRSWRLFGFISGISMDYYAPLEHRSHSLSEFMNEWIIKQFLDQFRDMGLEKPWYWDTYFLPDIEWFHHACQLATWHLRPTLWWSPNAGVSAAERVWLEQKYPGWNEKFGKPWDVIAENIQEGRTGRTLPETLPLLCNICNLTIVTPIGHRLGYLESLAPLTVKREGRQYSFCSTPCKWIFEQSPERYAGHFTLVDQFIGGKIQPATLEGVLAYMGMSAADSGEDATCYAWVEPRRKTP